VHLSVGFQRGIASQGAVERIGWVRRASATTNKVISNVIVLKAYAYIVQNPDRKFSNRRFGSRQTMFQRVRGQANTPGKGPDDPSPDNNKGASP
jgi:hypothetical protein